MDQNEGTMDRVIRTVLGLGLLSLVVIGPQSWWGMIGIIPLLTGVVGYCPLYRILGLRSCPVARFSSHSMHPMK